MIAAVDQGQQLPEPDYDFAFALAESGVDLRSDELCIRALQKAGYRYSLYRPALEKPRWTEILLEARRIRTLLAEQRAAERAKEFPPLAEIAGVLLCLAAAWGWVIVLGMKDAV